MLPPAIGIVMIDVLLESIHARFDPATMSDWMPVSPLASCVSPFPPELLPELPPEPLPEPLPLLLDAEPELPPDPPPLLDPELLPELPPEPLPEPLLPPEPAPEPEVVLEQAPKVTSASGAMAIDIARVLFIGFPPRAAVISVHVGAHLAHDVVDRHEDRVELP
jgi:hypothetical protein